MESTKIKICMICGGPASERWKVSRGHYICDKCYKRLFIEKTMTASGERINNENSDRNELRQARS